MYFFDSSALIEIIRGNVAYDKYKVEIPTCTILNLFEVHQALLREFNKQTADYWIKKFNYELIEITKEDIIKASDLRFKFKDRKLSSIDCIGYIVAMKMGFRFLTGDRDFDNFTNVEFVK